MAVAHASLKSVGTNRLVGQPILRFDPDDDKTAQMLSAGDSLGVFQSESPGMRQLLRGLKVKSKKDLAIALSLIRPGPASGGMKNEFIERHVHGKAFTYLHPKIEKLLGDTYGVMLYQEDVMRIAVEIAGYTVAEADRFRSEVSKKVSAARVQAQYMDFVHRRAEQAGIEQDRRGHLGRGPAFRRLFLLQGPRDRLRQHRLGDRLAQGPLPGRVLLLAVQQSPGHVPAAGVRLGREAARRSGPAAPCQSQRDRVEPSERQDSGGVEYHQRTVRRHRR